MSASLESSSLCSTDTAESSVSNAIHQGAQLVRGFVTVYRRRGFGFAVYLITDWLWPAALYRFAWGPRSWRPFRLAFDAVGRFTSTPASEADLRRAGIMTPDLAPPSRSDSQSAAALMDRAHAANITGLPARPRLHRRRGAHYVAARNADRRRFNQRWGTALLTEESARELLVAVKARISNGYRDYAPIDFGHGLTVGRFAATDSGTGRWQFFNGPIVGPLVAGKRVLDLGCNNGSMTTMMLRAGAREIVAVELSEEIADFARLNAGVVSWRDVHPYRLEVRTGDMRMVLTEDLGRFDVVTAFCSLYYLPPADMARIVRKAAEMGATLVLQANNVIDNLPAHTDQLRRLMEDNGYPTVQVRAARDFARPLLVGAPTR
jgi:2-polyprenyl-3-methyl-5-hydroxy-6-metoxy-1,4-benzoquinol methylase